MHIIYPKQTCVLIKQLCTCIKIPIGWHRLPSDESGECEAREIQNLDIKQWFILFKLFNYNFSVYCSKTCQERREEVLWGFAALQQTALDGMYGIVYYFIYTWLLESLKFWKYLKILIYNNDDTNTQKHDRNSPQGLYSVAISSQFLW